MSILIESAIRPNRFDGKRDEKFHLDMGRYSVYSGFNIDHSNWRKQIYINRNFWAGNQWIYEEDLESFLKDDSGQVRNRIKYVRNFVKGIVSSFTGNSIVLDLTTMAKSLSYRAKNRREEKLSELLFYTELASVMSEGYGEFLKKNMPIGESIDDTAEIFENIWVDEYTDNINKLLFYVSDKENFKQKQFELALDLCLTGLGVLKYDIYNGDFIFNRIRPENFFFDRACVNFDLSDSEFMGHYSEMDISAIYEKWQIKDAEVRKQIELYSNTDIKTENYKEYFSNSNNRVPVFFVYFKDFETYEYGWVKDEFDYPYLTKINHIYEGDEKPRYTDKDLIPVKELNMGQKNVTGGNNKKRLYVDLLRYIEFIPREVVSSISRKGITDIVLSYGVVKYQDTENERISNVKFPYKCHCWEYDQGNIYTPITQLINPQRMINRFGSVMDNIINNAMPPTVAYDKDLTDPQDIEDMMRNIYQGKPISLQTRGRGINNAITSLRGTLDDTVQMYYNLIDMTRLDMDRIVGVNESLKGESMGAEQLVGVTQLQIQRASLMQEPFYNALANIYLQSYQSIADVGKRVYIDNPRRLSIIAGDKGAEVLRLTEDYKLEDFRVFVERQPSYQQQIVQGNAELINLYKLQLIDDMTFSDLYNRSTPDDASKAVRKYAKDKSLVAKQMAEQQKIEQQKQEELQMGLIQQDQANKDQERIQHLAENQKERDNREQVARIKAEGFGRKNV